MTVEKRGSFIVGLVVAIIVLAALLIKVVGLEIEYALLISAGISIFMYFRIHAIIAYIIESKR